MSLSSPSPTFPTDSGTGLGWGSALQRVVILLMCVLFAGCDPESFSEAPLAACAAIGSQCQLPDGPLGVCQEAPCGAGETRPCFTCTSQH